MRRQKQPIVKIKPEKAHSFTDDKICERAYSLWKENPERTAEENWQAAIRELQQEQSLSRKIHRYWQVAISPENRNFTLELLKIGISAFGVLATLIAGAGLYLTYQNSLADRKLTTERLLTDRFAKAVEQIGNRDTGVQLGGVYALERIARDSPKDYWAVMEVLTAYIRYRSQPLFWSFPNTGIDPNTTFKVAPELRPNLLEDNFGNTSALRTDLKNSKNPKRPISINVQAALTVVGRREAKNDQGNQLDLSNSNLTGADLSDANLSGADLYYANFSNSDLTDANLINAEIYRADFRGAKGITPEQIKVAKYWEDAYYDGDFRKKLGLPPENP